MHQRCGLATFARTLGNRLDEGGKVIPVPKLARIGLRHGEGRRRRAGSGNEALRHALVERCRHGERVGEEIRLIEQLAQRRNLRLARPAAHTLGNREHEIEALARGQPRRKHLAAADSRDGAAEGLQRRIELIDGVDIIELGYLLLGEAERAIIVPEVVDEADLHQRSTRDGARSAPTVPSGSV